MFKFNSRLRQIFRNSLLDVLGVFARPANGVHILNGHMIDRNNPQIETFISQLEQLEKFATFIRIEEAIALISERKVVNKCLVAFTFDDGFAECASMIAPALEKFGTNGLFFINPNFVDGNDDYILNFTDNVVLSAGKQPMRWNDIIMLQNAGHLIGAHTMDHYMINSGDIDELKHQIIDCKEIIEAKLGTECNNFAFPFGRLDHANQSSIDIACQHYKYVFSQSDYKKYFSFKGKVINRRHFEPNWPINHLKYFISCRKEY
jgi:peptidoglycan/xylan/chitin deacetylase (PgdA/CDA1 family)